MYNIILSIISVFVYNQGPSDGLHIAYQNQDQQWEEIGQLLSSDYGAWGQEKRMFSPFITRVADGSWRAVWQVNDTAPTFAAAYSADLITWRPQDYPIMTAKGCFRPVLVQSSENELYVLFQDAKGQLRQTHATDEFRRFSMDEPCTSPRWLEDYRLLSTLRDTITIDGKQQIGQLISINNDELLSIQHHYKSLQDDASRSKERMHQDAEKLSPILPASLKATLSVDNSLQKNISDKLIGIFFEDISYAADGGLYAELIQNRDFEYTEKDYNNKGKAWHATIAWKGDLQLATDHPLSIHNPHHILLENGKVWNKGWDGICLKKGEQYDFSCYLRNIDCKKKQIRISLVRIENGQPIQAISTSASAITSKSKEWTRYKTTFIANEDCNDACLMIEGIHKGSVAIDMVSLFPHDTYKGHGLRKDLAQAIAALHPKFVRFPGGCMSHGQGIDNIYHWSETIGPWQDRKPDMNIWRYHQTRGLGFYEYFQWCEDMGAEPLPVLAAGVPCQNSQADARGMGGQQGGIPMAEMQTYIDEILHLIEWANADATTNEWAKKRAEAGHPEPFHLKYIGIGNEDLVSTTFEERYEMITTAIHERYPDIIICGTAGPFHTPSSDYIEGWRFNNAHPDLAQMVDEHYYESTGWFLNHQDYYDHYDRTKAKVYLGEWSSNSDKRRSDVECALTEAIYLCNVERNGDIVAMTSYAPLLCHEKHKNWDPDMIYFDNEHVTLTPSYETQRLFGTYSGNTYIPTTWQINTDHSFTDSVKKQIGRRLVASLVKDTKSGKSYLRLINALPVATEIDLQGLTLPDEYLYEELSGKPSDIQVCTQLIKTKGTRSIKMPPYSFRVIVF